MAKRRVKIKRSKSEQLEIDLNRWLGKKNDAIELLIKSMAKLKELGRAGVRLEKNEQRKRHEKKMLARAKVSDVPARELGIPDVLPHDYVARTVRKASRKRKADATVQGSA